ncbi:GTP cyclohydrolase [Flavobacteriaceae bacterium S356]|uniref:GTP cyclohydrolase n=1 Tax=Asprobacillus argus TaxID=3076534 RepID=A0ABU3LI27_9FLAO|nr:GTP cyclohydrolase [Flavobacteriaceae bacterium S356]
MITLQECHTKKEMKQFVTFPFSIYKNSKYWVPPIIKDELETFDKKVNPAFENADAYFYVALREGKIVGRIAAIINRYEVNEQKIKKMRFGWFDVIDDIDVTKVLLAKVKEIGKENNLEYMEGPVGFSNLDKVGVLIDGFDHIGTMITWYTHPYYKEHLEQLGFVKEKEYLENKFQLTNVDAAYYERISKLICRRFHLTALSFTKTKDILPYVDEMFDLFNKTYATLSSYVPISDSQIAYFKNKYISFINPEFIKFVIDADNKLVAFGIMMPSFSLALQKAKGKLFPFGIFHLLKARKNPKVVTSYLIGVDPQYQNKGVTGIIFSEFANAFNKIGVETIVRTPELEENTAIHQLWKSFDPVTHKRRRTYRLNI